MLADNPAGRSATRRFKELVKVWRRRARIVIWPLFAIAGLLGFAGYEASGQTKFWFAFVAGAFLGVTMALRDSPPQYIEAWRLGSEGERRTASRLALLPHHVWRVWHDVADEPFGNIDHIVLGNAGVFVLESKNYSGDATLENGLLKIRRLGERGDGWTPEAIGSAARGASRAVHQRIHAAANLWVWVQPVVVLWARFPQHGVEDSGVFYLNGDRLAEWLTSRPPADGGFDLDGVAHALDAAVRPSR